MQHIKSGQYKTKPLKVCSVHTSGEIKKTNSTAGKVTT